MSNMHARIMSLRSRPSGLEEDSASHIYRIGHSNARYAAAEIAAKGDAVIADLLAALEALYAVTPNTPPAAGIVIGIEEKHAKALAMTRAAIARAKGEA